MRAKSDAGYYKWMGRYLFYSPEVEDKVINAPDEMENITAQYIIIEDVENPLITKWIERNYPDQIGREVVVR